MAQDVARKVGSPTALTAEEEERCWHATREHLRLRSAITNADLRSSADVSFDQAIRFFNKAIADGSLVRAGKGPATHYLRGPALPQSEEEALGPPD